MKLYFSPGACSLAPHIVLHEAGLRFDIERVSLSKKETASGADYKAINAKGYVPALQLDNGEVLTEVPAIVQYVADQAPAKELVPSSGNLERYRVIEWLSFISTEVHKTFGPLFDKQAHEAAKQAARDKLSTRLDYIEQHLQQHAYLMGENFSIADAYLFTIVNWAGFVKFPLDRWNAIEQYQQRIARRPAVQAAMVAEGLIKTE